MYTECWSIGLIVLSQSFALWYYFYVAFSIVHSVVQCLSSNDVGLKVPNLLKHGNHWMKLNGTSARNNAISLIEKYLKSYISIVIEFDSNNTWNGNSSSGSSSILKLFAQLMCLIWCDAAERHVQVFQSGSKNDVKVASNSKRIEVKGVLNTWLHDFRGLPMICKWNESKARFNLSWNWILSPSTLTLRHLICSKFFLLNNNIDCGCTISGYTFSSWKQFISHVTIYFWI